MLQPFYYSERNLGVKLLWEKDLLVFTLPNLVTFTVSYTVQCFPKQFWCIMLWISWMCSGQCSLRGAQFSSVLSPLSLFLAQQIDIMWNRHCMTRALTGMRPPRSKKWTCASSQRVSSLMLIHCLKTSHLGYFPVRLISTLAVHSHKYQMICSSLPW